MKIAIPEISVFQWHPISISSSPYQQVVTLHIRKRGYWTKRIHDLAGMKSEISILLEGPFGSLAVDLTSTHRYAMMMLLSGGIGVTPMQSVAHQLMYEHEWGERKLKKLWFVWTARDPQVMSSMDVVANHSNHLKNADSSFHITDKTLDITDKTLEELEAEGPFHSETKSDASTILSLVSNSLNGAPSSMTTDEQLKAEYSMEDVEESDDEYEVDSDGATQNHRNVHLSLDVALDVNSCDGAPHDQICVEETTNCVARDEEDIPVDDNILEMDCYLTAKEIRDCGLESLPFVNKKRPDMKGIFLGMRQEAMRQNEKRVAVCICGPTRLVDITRKACVKFSNRHVRFDFHYEVFD